MKRLPLLLLPLLAACAAPAPEGGSLPGGLGGIFARPEAEPEAPPPLPPQVVAALPPGVPQSVVVRNGDGCYLVSVEVTVPPSGYPLEDAAGNPVCDGTPVATVAPPVTPPVTPTVTPPVPLDGGGLGPDTAPPLVPGNITPPAPIAPPNPA
ncbi:hypothetical protein [Rubellimicrobium aerolatum]|uniref:Uncharacterized protein n=1 Tax=Rubellimicrobium aerolatum TaxID=490979 RepID=A0ABW0S9U8_9RHOB|nr:hypothetical protein [Rubellimicrobium aerolatum]MBP1805023.1 hypothetical protein [Rubellimicrobium aerolatum]